MNDSKLLSNVGYPLNMGSRVRCDPGHFLCSTKDMKMICILMLFRPSPDKILECFVEVSAPEDSGKGTNWNVSCLSSH